MRACGFSGGRKQIGQSRGARTLATGTLAERVEEEEEAGDGGAWVPGGGGGG